MNAIELPLLTIEKRGNLIVITHKINHMTVSLSESRLEKWALSVLRGELVSKPSLLSVNQ